MKAARDGQFLEVVDALLIRNRVQTRLGFAASKEGQELEHDVGVDQARHIIIEFIEAVAPCQQGGKKRKGEKVGQHRKSL